MSKTCELLLDTVQWVEALSTIPVVYIAEDTVPNSTSLNALLEFAFHSSGTEAELRCGPLRTVSAPGTLIVNNGHFGFHGMPQGEWSCWVLSLDVSVSAPVPWLSHGPLMLTSSVREVPRLLQRYENVERARRRGGAMGRIHLKAAVLVLLAEMVENVSADPATAIRSPLVDEALAIMHSPNRMAGLTVRDVAAEVGLSEDHFGRRFKAEMGIPPGRYLARARMERAQALLLRTPLRIKEVATAVGFADGLSLSKAFRKHTGLSPRQWRRRQ